MITREDIQRSAYLARLGLREEEIEKTEKELENILGYIDRLQKVDTTNVPETSSPPAEASAFRSDEVIACPPEDRELILKNFPARQGDLLKVPAVFERPKK